MKEKAGLEAEPSLPCLVTGAMMLELEVELRRPGEVGKKGDENPAEPIGGVEVEAEGLGRLFMGTFFRSTLPCGMVSDTRAENGSALFAAFAVSGWRGAAPEMLGPESKSSFAMSRSRSLSEVGAGWVRTGAWGREVCWAGLACWDEEGWVMRSRREKDWLFVVVGWSWKERRESSSGCFACGACCCCRSGCCLGV